MSTIKIGDWVRVTRGVYMGAEGEVTDLYDARDSGPLIAVIDLPDDTVPADVSVSMLERCRSTFR